MTKENKRKRPRPTCVDESTLAIPKVKLTLLSALSNLDIGYEYLRTNVSTTKIKLILHPQTHLVVLQIAIRSKEDIVIL